MSSAFVFACKPETEFRWLKQKLKPNLKLNLKIEAEDLKAAIKREVVEEFRFI